MSKIKIDLLHRLREVSSESDARYGICTQVRTVLPGIDVAGYIRSGLRDELEALFRQWPGYSGKPDYPVPSDWEGPESAYLAYRDRKSLWGHHTYGNRRRELLAFCISTLENELEHVPGHGDLMARDRLFLYFKEQGCTTTQANAAVKYTTPGSFAHFVAHGELDLIAAFAWGSTPEGFRYWSKIVHG